MLGYQCFFIERANIFTVWQQHIVLLVIRQYEGKSYHLFVEDWLFEAYHLRIVSYPVIPTTYAPPPPHYTTTLQKFAVRLNGTILTKIIFPHLYCCY
jgi:hypothetical protein